MSNKNFKELLNEIRKLAKPTGLGDPAAPPPPPKGGPTNLNPPGGGGGTGGGTGGGYVNAAGSIKEMQKSIQNFAKVATGYKTKTVSVPPAKPGGKATTKEVMDGEDPRKDFNDFVSEQYTNGSGIHGVEFNPDEGATSKDEKKPTENIEMDNVIDGLRRIGSPKPGEKIPDGVWDFRTQNAVMQTFALADAMVQITAFMAAPPQQAKNNFTASDLGKFAAAIPKVKEYPATSKSNVFLTKVPPADMKASAETITDLVDKLSNFYQYYSKYVVEHPAYTAAISKKTPLITAKSGGDDRGAVKPEYAEVAKAPDNRFLRNVTLPWKNGDKVVNGVFPQIPLSVLKDVQSFRKFMLDSMKYTEADINTPEVQASVLGALDKHIRDTLSAEPPAKPTETKVDTNLAPKPKNVAVV